MTAPIPAPRTLPFLGNVTQIEKEMPLRSYVLLARQYGEIYRLMQFSQSTIVVSSYRLAYEACDEKRFVKNPSGALEQVRNGVGDGLFTAKVGEENWGIAHRLLMPAFGTTAIKDMFDDMNDIAMQLVMKWERFGPGAVVTPAEDFTRLAFDTIAFCSMSHRLNSFYSESTPRFVQAMNDFLSESMARAFRPTLVTNVMGYNTKYEQDIKALTDLANEIIADRKANPTDKNDLLNRMLSGKDPKSGKGLSDDNIKNNLLTFLIAGHETTSGTLSFLTYYLLKHPRVMRKLREEVDEVLGDNLPQVNDLGKLPYLTACLRETLRLSPPAPMRTIEALEDTTLGSGKYAVKKGEAVTILEAVMMRDPAVWGADADEFRPERMLEDNFVKLPPNAWQPFGNGMRACIGRAFFWQEALLMVSLMMQRFDLVMADPSYELRIKQAMTVKPFNFQIHVLPRKDRSGHYAAIPAPIVTKSLDTTALPSTASTEGKQRVYVLYGSNTGTSEAFAQRIISAAPVHGFSAVMGTLDAFASRLPSNGPTIIITASFEGEPADNAAHFVDWLSSLTGNLRQVSFGVFGCGNRDWAQTYQRIPVLIDELLGERGARRIVQLGEGDASAADFFDRFDAWEATLWDVLAKEYGVSPAASGDILSGGLQMKTVDGGANRASVLRQPDVALGTVIQNRVLTSPGAPVKRHLELELPEGMTYHAGDYLAVLPTNPARDVHRVIARFGLSPEQEIVLSSSTPSPLPIGQPITIQALLSGYVELAQPATSRDLRILQLIPGAPTAALQALTEDYTEMVLNARLNVLDILEDHPELALPFPAYLQLLPSMRVRQYSISSSPLWNPAHATLTVSVVDAPSRAGRKDPFLGVASTFLAGLRPGYRVQLAVRASAAAFHPPADPTVPMVMFAAGSGLAPMRGFLQERAMQKQAGREVAKSLLFFGCRKPNEDFLYEDTELGEWQALGIVDVRPAFSKATDQAQGCKYVQDRAWHDREDVKAAYNAQAKLYACGSRKVAHGIREVLTKIIKEARSIEDDEIAGQMFQQAVRDRYATDIFE